MSLRPSQSLIYVMLCLVVFLFQQLLEVLPINTGPPAKTRLIISKLLSPNRLFFFLIPHISGLFGVDGMSRNKPEHVICGGLWEMMFPCHSGVAEGCRSCVAWCIGHLLSVETKPFGFLQQQIVDFYSISCCFF